MKPTDFWDALAPIHASIEDNYFDRASARKLLPELRAPVLIVGAGQGLIVKELHRHGLACEGVDFSAEMVKQAKIRRGLDLVHADGTAMPFGNETYETVIYATGVIDFMSDDQSIRRILQEGRRVLKPSGTVLAAFYRLSKANEDFILRVGLLRNGVVSQRECLEMYKLSAVQMIGWMARRSGKSFLTATGWLLRMAVRGTAREKLTTIRIQRLFRDRAVANALIQSASEHQPYRREPEIRELFARLETPAKRIRQFATCWVAEIEFSAR